MYYFENTMPSFHIFAIIESKSLEMDAMENLERSLASRGIQ